MRHVFRWSLALLLSGVALAQSPITVRTDRGAVVGRQTAALNTFLGIPYAAPPLGNLRWQAPRPAAAWSTPLDAGRFGNSCPQLASGLFEGPGQEKGSYSGDENCLFLNVYAPRTATKSPVLVWIHGGGFTSGAGSDYDASRLAAQNGLVVVTFNYRLGPLGFLALPALSAETGGNSGNYGLQDQQAVLRWVQANIAAFGGDASQVTLAGESAGGMSVCAQLASPQAAGLFGRAIVQSGLCLSPGNSVTVGQAAQRNLAYAARLGCPPADLKCLRALDPRTLLATGVPGLRPLDNLVWSPVSGTPPLPLSLKDAFAQGRFNRVPLLAGSNRDEGRLFVSLASPGGRAMNLIHYWGGTGLLVGAANSARVLAHYPLHRYGTPALAFATLFTDAVFACPALAVDRAISKYVPVYAYEFADPQAVTALPTPAGLPGLGAFHSSSLVYLFQTPLPGLADPAQFSPAQRRLAETFSAAWVNFAKTGTPGWAPFDAASGKVQVFTPAGASLTTTFAADHQCSLWSSPDLN